MRIKRIKRLLLASVSLSAMHRGIPVIENATVLILVARAVGLIRK